MGKNWAIAIGINQYRYLQPLQYAVRDAAAMHDYFTRELGFERVYAFTDNSPPIPQDYGPALDSVPTFTTLKRFLRSRFEQPFLKPGDNLWFFFAGHGVRHEDRDYLMPLDGDPGEVEGTAIPLSYVTERLRRSGADNVVLLIDACRSEGKRMGIGVGEEVQQGVITLFSCSARESSYEIDQLQHGAFTYMLLRGLRLQGEGNCATVERLDQYLRHYLPQLNQRYNKPRQTPYTQVEPAAKYHLILLPRQATVRDAETLKMDAQRAELRKDFTLAKELWIRVLAVSPADHDAVEGIERLARVSAAPVPAPSPPSTSIGQRDATPPTPVKPSVPTFEFEVVAIAAVEKGWLGLGTPKIWLERRPGRAEYRVEDLGNGVKLELVAIPGGKFQMGSPDDEERRDDNEIPQHWVTVKPFLLGKYAVTQAQWQAVAALPPVNIDLDSDPAFFKGANRPVEQVNWRQAVEFCARLSQKTGREYRLPSEAEWEYACRAGTTTPFHFGPTLTTNLANYDGNYVYGSGPKGAYRQQTTDVGSFPPNAFGIYDMHGNVWEWCLDHWHDNYKGAPTDGSAWIEGGDSNRRLRRGGSWFDGPRGCRSAFRGRGNPGGRFINIGFRIVCGSAWTL